jgi:hypothetical protein
MARIGFRNALVAVSLSIPSTWGAVPVDAQTTYRACRFPTVGVIYMIGMTGTPSTCLDSSHIEFAWTEGGTLSDGSVTAAKLAFDPASQVELDAVTSGLSSPGTVNTPANPVDWTKLKGIPSDFADGVDNTGGGVHSDLVCASCVGTSDLADASVTANKLASGASAAIDHGSVAGLTDDDHEQYLLLNGARSAPDGFVVTGTYLSGFTPIPSGPGVRLIWHPARAAFRVGQAQGDEWNPSSIGFNSIALGTGANAPGDFSAVLGTGVASGNTSVAMGGSTASGDYSTAIGFLASATGDYSRAMGRSTTASGLHSIALGTNTTASGSNSTAMGTLTTASGTNTIAVGTLASTNGQSGTFAYGDGSSGSTYLFATAPNSFVVRAQRVWFGTAGNQVATAGRYIETSTGAYLTTGGAWTNASDVNRKENFRPEDAEGALMKVSALPIGSWNYRDEATSVRHLGPTAQDFHAAFGLGDSDRSIATVDVDGVALLAIQALERRTREIAELREANTLLRDELEQLRREVATLRTSP